MTSLVTNTYLWFVKVASAYITVKSLDTSCVLEAPFPSPIVNILFTETTQTKQHTLDRTERCRSWFNCRSDFSRYVLSCLSVSHLS